MEHGSKQESSCGQLSLKHHAHRLAISRIGCLEAVEGLCCKLPRRSDKDWVPGAHGILFLSIILKGRRAQLVSLQFLNGKLALQEFPQLVYLRACSTCFSFAQVVVVTKRPHQKGHPGATCLGKSSAAVTGGSKLGPHPSLCFKVQIMPVSRQAWCQQGGASKSKTRV